MQPTVLLVDDERHVTDGLKRHLRTETYRIVQADSAEEALAILADHPVDVIVSDERMTGMSGTEFLAQVSEHYPETVRIMLTGHATVETAIRAINDGSIYRFLKKPCDAGEIRLAIREGLRHKELVSGAYRLLARYRRQERTIAELETEYPGITHVNRDSHGSVILGDAGMDIDTLCRRIEEAVDESEERDVENPDRG